MSPLQFTQWKNQNNDLVKEFVSKPRHTSDHSDCGGRFANLLVALQSLPTQIMLKRLELSVAHSLLVITVLEKEEMEHGLEKVSDSLTRVVVNLNPAVVGNKGIWPLTDQVMWILEHLCKKSILEKLNISTLCPLSNTISLLILQLIQKAKTTKKTYALMDKFLALSSICLEIYAERTKIVKGGSTVTEGDIHNLVITDITKHVTRDDVSEAIILTRTIQVIKNASFDEKVLDENKQLPFGDNMKFYIRLLKALIYRKRRDAKSLYQEINILNSNKSKNPRVVSISALLLKAETLLDVDKCPQIALTFYSQVLRLDQGNIIALVGAAFCFGGLRMENSELDAWNIIVKTLHHGQLGKAKETATFVNHLLNILIPKFSLTLLDAVTILARKCLTLGKYCDAADKYLDVLSIKESCAVAFKDTTHPWQSKLIPPDDIVVFHEAALALLLAGRYSLAVEVCQKATKQWTRICSDVGKRKAPMESHEMFEDDLVSHFILAKALFELRQWDPALEMLDKCFRSCVLQISSREIRQSKCIRLDQGKSVEQVWNCVMWNRVQVIRARLYFEKSMVFKAKGANASFIACIKASLVLHPCPETSRQYLLALEHESCQKEIDSVKNSISKRGEEAFDLDLNTVEDQGLKYLLDDKRPIESTQLEKNTDEPIL